MKTITVKDLMVPLEEYATVHEGATLYEAALEKAQMEFDQTRYRHRAIHRLVMGHHQSLLATRGEKIVGILRLTDVFQEVCLAIKEFEQQA